MTLIPQVAAWVLMALAGWWLIAGIAWRIGVRPATFYSRLGQQLEK